MSLSFSDKGFFWAIVLMLVMAIFMGVIMWLVFQAKGTTEGVFEGLEDKMYESRMIYSPNCIAYKDELTGRTYSGTIDLHKFTDQNMERCIPLSDVNERAIIIELSYRNSEGEYVYKSIRTSNWDGKKGQSLLRSHSLPVNVHGEGPGTITFIHRY